MTKDEMNAYFLPATQHKKLAGEFIVWKEKQNLYYANGTGQTSEDRYLCGLVNKKSGDIAITTKHARVPLHSAYVIPLELAAKWPAWQGEDAVLGNKKITRDELIGILETLQ